MSHHHVARDTAEAGLVRIVGLLAGLMPCIAVVQVLANFRDYRQPVAAIAAWLAVLGAGAWLVPRLRTGGLSLREAVAAIVIAATAVAVIGLAHRPGKAPQSVDLAILGTSWLLVLVVLSRSPRVWIPGAFGVYAVHAVLFIRDDGLNAPGLSQLEAAAYIMAAMLVAFAAIRSALGVRASIAARQASLASRSAAERAAAAAIGQERKLRLSVLEREALPLLRGIADGTLDPRADSVTGQAARHALALRHSLTGRTSADSALVAALEPALESARSAGLLVTVQPIGELPAPQPAVARAVLGAVQAMLSALPPHQALLTIIASGDDVELYLSFAASPRSMPDLALFWADLPASAHWHAAVVPAQDGGGCLEISWRQASSDQDGAA